MNTVHTAYQCYITHIEIFGRAIKVWVQHDTKSAEAIEKDIHSIKEVLKYSASYPNVTEQLISREVCFAKYTDGEFYRCNVINVNPNSNSVNVMFIDYGNTSVINICDLKILRREERLRFPSLDLVGQASFYYLYGVSVHPGQMRDYDFDWLKSVTINVEFKCLIREGNFGIKLISIVMEQNVDLSQILIQKNLGTLTTVDDLCKSIKEMLTYPSNPGYFLPASITAEMMRKPPPILSQMSSLQQRMQPKLMEPSKSKPTIQIYQPPPVYQHNLQRVIAKEPATRVGRKPDNNIVVGATYQTYVSHVEDGPLQFSLQIKTYADDILPLLSIQMNKLPLHNYSSALTQGTIVMVMQPSDKSLRRGMIISAGSTCCKVYYVDFGSSEEIPHTNIFQLPSNLSVPLISGVALNFALNGIEKGQATDAIKQGFKDTVLTKTVLIRVVSEGPVRYCDMFLDGRNVRESLGEFDLPLQYLRQFPPREREVAVQVSFVESPSQFFVQYVCESDTLSSIGETTNIKWSTLPEISNLKELTIGKPVLSQFALDNKWYRAQVMDISNNDITVSYVDYGNKEQVKLNTLRQLTGDLVSKWRCQALECCLIGYENKIADATVADLLESKILSQEVTMKLHSLLSGDRLLVDIIDAQGKSVCTYLSDLKNRNAEEPTPTKTTLDSLMRNISVDNQPKNNPRVKGSHQKPDQGLYIPRGKVTTPSEEKPFARSIHVNDTWEEENKFEKVREKREEGMKQRLYRDDSGTSKWSEQEKGSRWKGRDEGAPSKWRDEAGSKWKSRDRDEERWSVRDDSSKWKERNDDSTPKWRPSDEGFRKKDDRSSDEGSQRWRKNDKWGDSNKKEGWKQRDRDGPDKKWSREDRYQDDKKEGFRPKYSKGNDEFKKNFSESRLSKFSQDTTEDFQDTVSDISPRLEPQYNLRVTEYIGWNLDSTKEHTVTLTHIETPDRFYVRPVEAEGELDKVRQLIGSERNSSFRQVPLKSITVGTPVLARYSDDNLLYRALISAKLENRTVEVLFVDYGNSSKVSNSELFLLTDEMGTIPMLAVCCSLSDTKPSSSQGWSAMDYAAIEECFGDDSTLRLTVDSVKCIDSQLVHSVTLRTLTGKLVAETLAEKGLAKVSGKGIMPAVSSEASETLDVSSVITGEKWQDRLELLVGQFLLVKVLSVVDQETIMVKLEACDLIVLCSVPKTDTSLEIGATMIIQVNCVLTDRLRVTLYTRDGFVAGDSERTLPPVSPVCPMPIVKTKEKIVVPHAEKTNLYIQKSSDVDKITKMLDRLYSFYEGTEGTARDWPKNALCAVKSSDQNWYRARIIDSHQVLVRFIDYGNTERVESNMIRVLDSQFHFPEMAFQVEYFVKTKQGIEFDMNDVLGDKEFLGFFLKKNVEQWLVDLYEADGSRFLFKMKELGYADEYSLSPFVEKNSVIGSRIITGVTVQVTVTHVESPNAFWIQLVNHINKVEAIQEKLQKIITDMPDITQVSGIFAAKYISDNLWYRAFECDSDKMLIRFIDYGNTDVAHERKELPHILVKPVSGYAIQMCLCVRPKGSEWDSEALKLFETFIDEEEIIAEIVSVSFKIVVDLKVKDTFISQILIEKGYAIYDDLTPEVIKSYLRSPESKPQNVYVCHTESLNEFYIQDESCSVDLEKMCTKLEEAEEYTVVTNFEVSDLVIAQDLSDMVWYRAKVINTCPLRVSFIDYGNTAEVSALLEMPEDLKSVPPYAVKCSLGTDIDSVEALEKFIELADEGNTSFEMKIVMKGDPEIVKLSYENADVLSLLPQILKKEVIINEKTVYVSHSIGPSDFYVQLEGSNQLDNVVDELTQAFSFGDITDLTEDLFVAALYPEDGQWYRARVLSVDPLDVFFYDYGNKSSVSEVKELPPDLKSIPALAHHCSLVKPSSVTEWSAASRSSFFKIVDDGKTAFTLTLKAPGEPNFVNLITTDGLDLAAEIIKNPSITEQSNIDRKVVYISYVDSLDCFYVQLEDSSNTLNNVSNSLTDSPTFRDKKTVQIGEIVSALFPEDLTWYRAKVLTNEPEINVLFVDYGNESIVLQVKELPDGLKSIPHLAVKCALKKPSNVETWSEEAETKFFDLSSSSNKFTVFLYSSGETNRVALRLKERDVINLIQENQEGSHTESLDTNKENSHSLDVIFKTRANQSTSIDKKRAIISHFNSIVDFYINLEEDTNVLDAIIDYLADASKLKDRSNIEFGSLLVAEYPVDGLWYRAKVCQKEPEIMVFLIDYGNITTVSSVKQLPDVLKQVPPLAHHCSLKLSRESRSFLSYVESKFIDIAINESNVFTIHLETLGDPSVVSLDLNSADLLNTIMDSPVSIQDNESVTITSEVISKCSNDAVNIAVRNNSDFVSELISSCSDNAVSAAEKNVSAFASEVISECSVSAVKAADANNSNFVSGIVLECVENAAGTNNSNSVSDIVVECVDYAAGTNNSNSVSDIVLECVDSAADVNNSDFVSECIDNATERNGSNSVSEHVGIATDRKTSNSVSECVDSATERNNSNFVSDIVLECVDNATDTIISESTKNETGSSLQKKTDFSKCKHKAVVISHINNISHFYVQLIKDVDEIADLFNTLSTADGLPDAEDIEIGSIVVAQFPADKSWYRAIIVNSTVLEAQFIDYGNVSKIHKVKKIPDTMKNIPPFSNKCSLKKPAGLTSWTSEMEEKFLKYQNSDDIIMTGDSFEEVVLNVDGLDVTDTLINISLDEEEENMETVKVRITHCNSPHSFYVQRVTSVPSFEALSSQIQNNKNLKDLTDVRLGDIVVAQFLDDGVWYRAEILSKDPGLVKCIDVGNSFAASMYKELPEGLKIIPPLADHCTLVSPKTTRDWSTEAVNYFIGLTSDGPAHLDMVVLQKQTPLVVDLFHSGSSITGDLLDMCPLECIESPRPESPSSFDIVVERIKEFNICDSSDRPEKEDLVCSSSELCNGTNDGSHKVSHSTLEPRVCKEPEIEQAQEPDSTADNPLNLEGHIELRLPPVSSTDVNPEDKP